MVLSSSSISWMGEYVNALGSMVNDEKYDLGSSSDNRPKWKDGKAASAVTVYLSRKPGPQERNSQPHASVRLSLGTT